MGSVRNSAERSNAVLPKPTRKNAFSAQFEMELSCVIYKLVWIEWLIWYESYHMKWLKLNRPLKDKYRYTVPWLGITGGVMAFTQSQYEAVNGFSNEYWGWGCEDDDMFVRIVDSCLHLEQGKASWVINYESQQSVVGPSGSTLMGRPFWPI